MNLKSYPLLNNFILKLTINNIVNNSFSTFILFLFVLNGNFESASDIAIIGAFTILITRVFSLNLRNIFIAQYNKKNLNEFIFLRLIFSILLFLICSILSLFYLNVSKISIYLLIFIFIIQWSLELVLVKFELDNNKKKNHNLLIVNLLTILFLIISSFSKNYYLFDEILIFYIFSTLFIAINSLQIKNVNFNFIFFKKLLKIFKDSLFTYSFLSSFSLNIANLIWRILVTFFVGKAFGSIIFFFYAIGSFPGTIFNASFGPTMVQKKLKFNFLTIFFIFYLIFLFFVLYLFFINFENELNLSNQFIKNIIIFSILGSFIMLFAVYKRQKILQKSPSLSNSIFYKDFVVSVFLILLIPSLFYQGGSDALAFSYFFGSVISLFIYHLRKIK